MSSSWSCLENESNFNGPCLYRNPYVATLPSDEPDNPWLRKLRANATHRFGRPTVECTVHTCIHTVHTVRSTWLQASQDHCAWYFRRRTRNTNRVLEPVT